MFLISINFYLPTDTGLILVRRQSVWERGQRGFTKIVYWGIIATSSSPPLSLPVINSVDYHQVHNLVIVVKIHPAF